MHITLDKDFIKKVKKELRHPRNVNIGVSITIDFEEKYLKLSLKRYNKDRDISPINTVDISLKNDIEVEYNECKRLYFTNIPCNDVFFDVLLSDKVYFELYKRNLKGFKGVGDIEYYLSTIIIKNDKKCAKYDEICSEHYNCIIV